MSRHYVRTSRRRAPRPPGPPGRRASRPRPGPPARPPRPGRAGALDSRTGAAGGIGAWAQGSAGGEAAGVRVWVGTADSGASGGVRRGSRRRRVAQVRGGGRGAARCPGWDDLRRPHPRPGGRGAVPVRQHGLPLRRRQRARSHTPVRHGRRVLPREPQNGRRRRLRGRVRDVRPAVGASTKASKVQVRRVGAWEDLVPDVCVRRGGAWTKAQAKGVPHLANPPDAGRLLRSS